MKQTFSKRQPSGIISIYRKGSRPGEKRVIYREKEKMTRRSTRRKTSATNLLETPLPETSPPPMTPTRSASESPKEFGFNFNTTSKLHSSTSMKKNTSGGTSVSKLLQPTVRSSLPSLKGINNVSDLKQLASSQMESLKRQLDRSHEEITKEIEASQSRLQKRFKVFRYLLLL